MEDNFFQTLGQVQDPSFMQPSAPRPQPMPQPVAQPAEAPRERRSVLDVIGTLADGFAKLGGSEPMYQPTLDARLAREQAAELYPLEKQKLQLENSKGQVDIRGKQIEVMGQMLAGTRQVYDRFGPEGLAKAWPTVAKQLGMVGLAPEEVQGIGAAFSENPDQAFAIFEGLIGAGEEEYGLTPTRIRNPQTGEVRLIQMGKSGRSRSESIPPGFELADPLMAVDRGTQTDLVSRQTAVPQATFSTSGKPAQGDVQLPGADGQPTGQFAVAPGSAAYREAETKLSEQLSTLEKLDGTLRTSGERIASVEKGIGLMANSGAMTKPDMSIGRRAVAVAQDVIPLVERVFNEDATTGREMIRSAALSIVTDLGAALQQAEGAGVAMTSKMMDTPRELELKLDTIANARDYESATETLKFVKDRAKAAQAELSRAIAAKRKELDRLRKGGPVSQVPANDGWVIEEID